MKRLLMTFLALFALTWGGIGHAEEVVEVRTDTAFAPAQGHISQSALLQQALRVITGHWVRELTGIDASGDTPDALGRLTHIATDPALRLDVHDDGLTMGYTFHF